MEAVETAGTTGLCLWGIGGRAGAWGGTFAGAPAGGWPLFGALANVLAALTAKAPRAAEA